MQCKHEPCSSLHYPVIVLLGYAMLCYDMKLHDMTGPVILALHIPYSLPLCLIVYTLSSTLCALRAILHALCSTLHSILLRALCRVSPPPLPYGPGVFRQRQGGPADDGQRQVDREGGPRRGVRRGSRICIGHSFS